MSLDRLQFTSAQSVIPESDAFNEPESKSFAPTGLTGSQTLLYSALSDAPASSSRVVHVQKQYSSNAVAGREGLSKSEPEPRWQSAFEPLQQARLLGEGIVSGLALNPINGLTQFTNRSFGTNFKAIHFGNESEIDSSISGNAGKMIGTSATFIALALATKKFTPVSPKLLGSAARLEAVSFGTAGAIQGGLLTPTQKDLSDSSFFLSRGGEALLGGGSAVLGAQGSRLAKLFHSSAPSLGVTGARLSAIGAEAAFNGALGAGTAHAYSYLKTGKFASSQEVATSAILSSGIGLGASALSFGRGSAALDSGAENAFRGASERAAEGLKSHAQIVSLNSMTPFNLDHINAYAQGLKPVRSELYRLRNVSEGTHFVSPDPPGENTFSNFHSGGMEAARKKNIEALPAPETVSRRPLEDSYQGFAISPDARQFISKIESKFNVRAVEEAQLIELLEELPQDQRSLAVKILEDGLPNSSEVLFAERLRSLRLYLEKDMLEKGIEERDFSFSTEDNSGWGKALHYLFRKLAPSDGSLSPVKPGGRSSVVSEVRVARMVPKRTIVLLDEPGSTAFSQNHLKRLESADQLYVLDLGGFKNGLNFFDFAMGPQSVKAKLKSLLSAVEQRRAARPQASEQELIDEVIRGKSVDSAVKLNANTVLVRAHGAGRELAPQLADESWRQRAQRVTSILNEPKASTEKIEQFLGRYAPENQAPVAYMVAEGSDNITYKDIFAYIDDLYGKLESGARSHGLSPDDLLFHDPEAGDSVDLVNYMFRLRKGIAAERFVSKAELDERSLAGELDAKGVVLLDDASYTGDKIGKRFNRIREASENSKAVFFGVLRKDLDPIFGHGGYPSVPTQTFFSKRLTSFFPESWPGASDDQVEVAWRMTRDTGFTTGINGDPSSDFLGEAIESHSNVVWPFAVPDNDIAPVRKFSKHVLGVGHVIDQDALPLEPFLLEHKPLPLPEVDSKLRHLRESELRLANPDRGSAIAGTIDTAEGTIEVMAQPSSGYFAPRGDLLGGRHLAERVSRTLGLNPYYPPTLKRRVEIDKATRLNNPESEYIFF